MIKTTKHFQDERMTQGKGQKVGVVNLGCARKLELANFFLKPKNFV